MSEDAGDGPRTWIAPARLDGREVDAFARFLVVSVAESGRDGLPHFALSRRLSQPDVRRGFLDRLSRRLDEPSWGRSWLLWAEGAPADRTSPYPTKPRVVGYAELKGGRWAAEMHRATLGMGILGRFTGRGHGPKLLGLAIDWAKENGLENIDLGVFATNAPARKLYERLGFKVIGVRPRAYRLEGDVEIDDVLMTLDLRAP